MKLGSFVAYDRGLAIDVIGLVLGRYFDRFKSHHPNDRSDKIIGFPEPVLKEVVVDYLW